MCSVDNLCKQFGSRPGLTKRQAWFGSKLFETLIFLSEFFEDINFEEKKKDDKKSPNMQRVKVFFCVKNGGSYMSAQFIEFIKQVGEKEIKCEACQAFHLFSQGV